MYIIFRQILARWSFFRNPHKIPYLSAVSSFFAKNKTIAKAICLSVLGTVAIVVTLLVTNVTLGFKVNYAGNDIGIVKNTSVFTTAKRIAGNSIDNYRVWSIFEKPTFRLTVTVSDRLVEPETLALNIMENTEGIVKATALIVNGEEVALTINEDVSSHLSDALNRFNIEGAENSSEFVDNVVISDGYYLENDISETEDFKNAINNLKVKTVCKVTSNVTVPYTTRTVEFASELRGYVEIIKYGSNGLNRKTESLELINGQVVSRTQLSLVTLKQPEEQVKAVGTARSPVTSSQTSKNFICPLNPGTFTVTSYWGDGRNHKGIDLAAPKGTYIFAVSNGTVVSAGWDGRYGYSVLIDHGNGLQTRYSHNSSLNVRKGDTVKKGDLIARVGSTGQSTGNHLHFEVIINGNRVNPAPYIGL